MWHPESTFGTDGHLDEGVVHAWLDDQLAPAPAAEVEAHVANCAVCAGRVAEARGLVAGASRVMASLDVPALAPVSVDRPVPAAGAPKSSDGVVPIGERRPVGRWSTRRISLAAAAALVFVTGTLVLRDSGSVREMVQADQQVLGDSVALDATVPVLAQDSGASATTEDAAPAVVPPRATSTEAGVPLAGSVGGAQELARVPEVESAFRARPSSPAPPPSAGEARGAANSGAVEPGTAAKLAPAPTAAPAPVEPPSANRQSADAIVRARDVAATRDRAASRLGAQAADDRGRARSAEVWSAQSNAPVRREAAARSSAEIQAIVRMVSSCWRIADTDSVVELLPQGGSTGAPDARWLPGWVRVGRDDTNPDRAWWLPLADSVSVRVRLEGGRSDDLVITPRPERVQLWRVPRGDSLATWESIPRGATAEPAVSVRCAL